MVIGILATSSSAETLLNNLAEADFKRNTISVIIKDQKIRDAIASDTGPFKGLALGDLAKKLVQVGLPSQDVQTCGNAVAQGKVLIAIATPSGSENAAVEMFKDSSAEFIRVVGK